MQTLSDDSTNEDVGLLMGALLRIPYAAMMEKIERGLVKAGYPDVRSTHFPLIQSLFQHPEGARSTQLAAWTHMKKQSMGELIDYLEGHGYVRRIPDPRDRRAHRVQLTERGKAMTRTTRSLVRQVEVEWEQTIGPSALNQLRHHLQALVDWLQQAEQNGATP